MQRVLVVFVLCLFLVPSGCENKVTDPGISEADVELPLGEVGKKIKEDKIPDEYMVFTRFDAGGTWTLDLLLMNLQNPSSWIPVAQNAGVDEGFPSWSPSGDQIVYSAGPIVPDPTLGPVSDPRTWDLHIVEVTGLPPVIGTPTNLEVKGHRPDWSPDGNYIAFECYPAPIGPLDLSSKGDICYIAKGPAGSWGSPQNLTNTPDANERFPTWSPGSDRLVFERWTQSGGAEVVDIYTVDLTGSETQLTNTPSFHERQPAWSVKNDIAYVEGGDLNWPIVCPPPPNQLECEQFDNYSGIWTMPVATPVGAKRLTSTPGDLAPHWTSNGNQVVFSGDGQSIPAPWGGSIAWPDVFVIDSQGKNRLNLTGVSLDGEFWGRLRN